MEYEACAPFNRPGFPSDKSIVPAEMCSIPIAPPEVMVIGAILFLVVRSRTREYFVGIKYCRN